MSSPKNKWKRRLGTLAPLVVSGVLLAWVIIQAGADRVWADLIGLDLSLYALAGLFFYVGVVLRSWRWLVLLRDLEAKATLGQLVAMYTTGIFFDNLLPTGVGGDIVRAMELRRESQRGADSVSSVVVNRLIGIFTMSSLGVIALLANPGIFPAFVSWSIGGVALAIIAGVWLVRRDVLTWLSERAPFVRPVTNHPKLRALHGTTTAYSGTTLLRAIGISVLFTLSLVATQFTIARAMGIHLAIKYFAVAAPVIGAVNMMPISFNGLGVREGVYQILFSSVGVAPSAAVAMSLAFYGLRLFVGFLGGALMLVGSARRLTAQERSQAGG